MILIGQYDSSFTRRVGIALRLYGMPFEHRPWSVFGDMDRIRPLNPLVRVPTLVLDDGTVLVDSHVMLDWMDEQVPAERAMFPRSGIARRDALRVAALATGVGDRMVSLFYERRLHEATSALLVGRREAEIASTLAALEADRAGRPTPWWFGETIGHADIAVACVLRHLGESLPDLWHAARYPALAAHSDRAEALPAFREISQPFVAPA